MEQTIRYDGCSPGGVCVVLGMYGMDGTNVYGIQC